MALDRADREFFDRKFTELHEKINDKTGELHGKIDDSMTEMREKLSDHEKEDLKALSEVKDLALTVQSDVSKEIGGAVKGHEDIHHVIGWPKILGIIVMIAGAICGIAAFFVHH